MKRLKSMNKPTLALVSLIAILAVVGVTYATLTIASYTINKITTPHIGLSIEEEYTEPDSVYPGDTVNKTVNVKNTGNIDSLVRVSVTKAWGSSRDGDGNLVIDNTLSGDNISLNINTENWVDGKDGYYYYLGMLQPNQTTLEPLFTTFTVDKESGNEYIGKFADIIVNAETIQAEGNAVSSLWNKSYAFLNLEEPKNTTDLGKTTVTLVSPTDKFNIENNKIDLFNNFKDLLPGTGRSQTITVTNSYNAPQEILLKAETTTQDEQTKTKIDKLLNEYVTITINNGSNVVYTGPIGGNLDSATNTMKDYISLGSFDKDESKDLVVKLNVDSAMGNEYQDLLGNIKWVFQTTFADASLTVHHYLEGTTIKLADDVTGSGYIGQTYTTSPVTLTNYELVETPANATGTYVTGSTVVNYYYKLKNATFTEPVVTKTGTTKLTSATGKIDYAVNFSSTIQTYKGTAIVTIVDTLPQTIDVANSTLDGGVYNATNKTITWTENVNNIDTYTNGNKTVNYTKNISVKYTSLDYDTKTMTNNVTGKIKLNATNEEKSDDDTHDTTIEVPAKVTSHYYLEGTTVKLDTDVVSNGLVGNNYTTSAKTIANYTLVATPTNATGKYTVADQDVNYYYRLTNATFETPTVTKTATAKITSPTGKVDYTINFTDKITVYKGTATVTIVDTLPQTIDVANSTLDGGVYNATNKTITWTETVNNIDTYTNGDKTVTYTKNIKVAFTSLDYDTKSMVNNVTGKIKLNATNEEKSDDDTATTTVEVPAKVTAHYYLEGTTTKLSTDEVKNGLVGNNYSTSSKTIANYELVSTPTNQTGKYTVADQEVIYYYHQTSGGFTTPTVNKTGTEKLVKDTDKVTYKIDFSSSITEYKGTATVTIVDTLPQTIDVANSTLDGGVYNATNKTITWTETVNNIDTYTNGNKTVSYTKNLTLKYTSLDYDTKTMTNSVTGKIKLNATNEEKQATDTLDTTIEVPAKVTAHHYLEGTTIKLSDDVISNGLVGNNYATSAKTIQNYTLVATPTNATGKYTVADQNVNYYYKLTKATYTDPVITKTSTDKITSKDSNIDSIITFEDAISVYKGTATVTIVDTLPQTIDVEHSTLDGGVYDATSKTITWTVNISNIDTYVDGTKNISITKNVSLKYTSLDYVNKEMTNTAAGKIKLNATNEEKTVTDDATTDIEVKGKVISHYYIKDTTTELASNEESSGLIGNNYTTAPKDIANYELVATPANATGKYTEDDIDVIYYYTLKEPITNNTISKEGSDLLTSKDEPISYTIRYNANVVDYTGETTLTIIDTLPYEIDETVSTLDGGVYDKDTKTITWQVTKNITTPYTEEFIYNISLKYLNLDYTKKIVNTVTAKLKIRDKVSSSTADKTTNIKIPAKVIVNHYYKDTTEKLVDSETIPGYIGDSYKTNVSQNVLNKGYTYFSDSNNTNGIMNDDVIVVNYYYEKLVTNPNTSDMIFKYILYIILSTGLMLSVNYFMNKQTVKN